MSGTHAPRSRFLWIAAPFLPWALHFFAIYSIQGLACGRGWSTTSTYASMAGLSIACLAATGWIGLHAWRLARTARANGERSMAATLVAWLSALSLLAIAMTTLPVLLLSPCE